MLLQRRREVSLGSGARSMAELLLSRSGDGLSLLPSGSLGNLRERARERTREVRAGCAERMTMSHPPGLVDVSPSLLRAYKVELGL
jgi:hypothetical protein